MYQEFYILSFIKYHTIDSMICKSVIKQIYQE